MTERNWETSARARLERLVAETVSRIRDAADQIERDARGHIRSAAEDQRQIEFQTYPRVAAQVLHTLQTLVFNIGMENLIDAADDAEKARAERLATVKAATEADPSTVSKTSVSLALYTLLTGLDGWIEGAHENHEALDHRGENIGEGCWTKFHPSDIRNMINDAARELGVGEFPLPGEGQAKEDQYQ